MIPPWYDDVAAGERLRQGEIIECCPVLQVAAGEATASLAEADLVAQWLRAAVIVMTQDCDLEQAKTSMILLCALIPISSYQQRWAEARAGIAASKRQEAWRAHAAGLPTTPQLNIMLLDRWPNRESGSHLVADLHQLFTLPRAWLEPAVQQSQQPRTRLRAPYLQKLAHKFGTLYSRVATDEPGDVPLLLDDPAASRQVE